MAGTAGEWFDRYEEVGRYLSAGDVLRIAARHHRVELGLRTVRAPGTDGLTPGERAYNNEWNGISLSGWFQSNSVTACMVDDLPQNTELTDTYEPPMKSSDRVLVWNETQGNGEAFVMRRRNADEIGNAFLAVGAATAALAIGFIPVVYDANLERRRARKRMQQA
ncbi:MAG: hypothetical protein JOY82_18470 [Streptosporangiaceae bacterium]|nr:hypothetical protein [Streptosporangiaceae bacterium]